jgi:antitoxin Phd
MLKTYTVAEAKNRLTELLHEVEREGPVQVTRRGKPIAFVISVDEYERLQQGRPSFWAAYVEFRRRLDADGIDLNPDEIFADVRDRAAPTEPRW